MLPPSIGELCDETLTAEQQLERSVRSWVKVACAATNALYQCKQSGHGRKPGKMHIRALEDMQNKVRRFLEGVDVVDGNFSGVVEDLKTKRISYTGEGVSQPHPLSVQQIIKGLPPAGHSFPKGARSVHGGKPAGSPGAGVRPGKLPRHSKGPQ